MGAVSLRAMLRPTPPPARIVLATALLAGAGLLAACGSSSGSSSSSSNGGNGGNGGTAPAGGPVTATGTTPCGGKSFGSPLAPKDAPSDVHTYSAAPSMQIDSSKLYLATISTAKGDIVLCLEPSLAPNTVNNFVVLARNHFYDGITFHRVVPNFVIQGGDPSGTGSGGPGYKFADEPVKGDYTQGCVAMANAGANTNGSQFFVCIADDTNLPKHYSLFGAVTGGMDVALKIAQGDVMKSVVVREQS
jgi:peptidyl-prolyl cis-trans isomerase B (cyclophilin B)